MIRKILLGLAIGFLLVTTASAAWVSGYFKSNGTYVSGYYRTEPNNSPYDNYNRPGNYNPNTHKVTPGNSNTYDNYYYQNIQKQWKRNYKKSDWWGN